MNELMARFEQAVQDSRLLSKKPDNGTLLQIYALYKQATLGNNPNKRPSFTDTLARLKHDAWKGLEGTTTQQAMQNYIDLIESLKN